jgi:hypothetical protein
MADIEFTCSNCRQTLEAPEEMAGEMVECPSCQQTIAIPSPAPREKAVVMCPECGAPMEPEAVLCVKCGFHRGLGRKVKTEFT